MYSPLYVRMRRDVACPHPLTVSHMCGHATSLRVRTHVSSCRTRNPIACPLSFHADTQSCCVSAMLQCGHAEKLRVRMKRQRTRNRIACPREKTADTQQNCVSAMLQCECPVVLHVRVMYRVYVRTGKIAAYPLVVHLSYSTQNNTISTCPS